MHRNLLSFIMAVIVITGFMQGLCADRVLAAAADKSGAILCIDFDNTQSAMQGAPGMLMTNIQDAFPEYDVYKLRSGELQGMLQELQRQKIKKVVIQPLLLTPDKGYESLQHFVRTMNSEQPPFQLVLSRPLLCYTGQAGKPDDYLGTVFAITGMYPKLACCHGIILAGRDNSKMDSEWYRVLQNKINQAGFGNIYVYQANGQPSLQEVLEQLGKKKLKKLTIIPLSLEAGASDSQALAAFDLNPLQQGLRAKGFTNLETIDSSLLENVNIQELFIQHILDAVKDSSF